MAKFKAYVILYKTIKNQFAKRMNSGNHAALPGQGTEENGTPDAAAPRSELSELTIPFSSREFEFPGEIPMASSGARREVHSLLLETGVSCHSDVHSSCDLSGENQRGFPELLVQAGPPVRFVAPSSSSLFPIRNSNLWSRNAAAFAHPSSPKTL